MDAGKKLRRFREQIGMSQRAMADVLNTTHVVVGRWERGVFKPNVHSLAKMAALMGCTIDELVKDEVTE
ncbi:helix-turn-helix domain-containing protein [Streptomyces sp. NPDC048521]|uniref:helix-turn-helix domain-containing protein n=1 Tax=Streptomyces sp. NPDC048521 TaxID=3365566 RepID=UPI0037177A07